jgi:AraC-like DNA-binding protein/quercetin dioxygenase-like cupin family protein
MTAEKLDSFLRRHNGREIEYLRKDFVPSEYLTKNDTFTIFSHHLLAPNETMTITKQHRFLEVPSHLHDYIELLYIYSGTYTQTIGGTTVHLKQGDICIIDTNMPHSSGALSENDIAINIIMRKDYFSTSLLSRLSAEGIISNFLVNAISHTANHESYLLFQPDDTTKIHSHMISLLCEYYDKSICSNEIISCYMVLLFSELLRVLQYSYYKKKNANQAQENLIDILQYLEQNYNNCTLESVAKQFGFHPNYLSTFIKKMTGQSFKEIIQTQRLLQASLLLRKTYMPVYKIACEVGYNNLTFFYRKFKEQYNITPLEYREKYGLILR